MLHQLPKNVFSSRLVSTLAITTHPTRCCEDHARLVADKLANGKEPKEAWRPAPHNRYRDGAPPCMRSALNGGGGRSRGTEWRLQSDTWECHSNAIKRRGWRARSSADRRVGRSWSAERRWREDGRVALECRGDRRLHTSRGGTIKRTRWRARGDADRGVGRSRGERSGRSRGAE